MPRRLFGVIACVAALAGNARAGTVSGTVFVDRDGDGVLSAGDDPVAGAAVFFETALSAETAADGTYSIPAPGAGIVWVSVPDGYRPGPVWQLEATGADAVIDLPLVPSSTTADARTFVVASDTHAGLELVTEDDIATGFDQLIDLEPAPAFFTVTGDLTQNNQPEQFATFNAAIAGIEVPFVPVPGNHDWYDGGAEYRRVFGPPSYSFDAGGVHYIVINDAIAVDARAAFVTRDLSHVTDDRPVVAFTHAPPPDELIAALEGAGVDYLFTGHLHSNRVLVHGALVEHNTQALAMGGIDTTPAGFRVVSFGDDDLAVITHRTTVDGPYVELAYPRPSDRVTRCAVDVVAAVEVGAGTPTVTARAGSEEVTLTRTGAGWTYTGRLESLCDYGVYDVVLEVETAGGDMFTRTAPVCVADADVTGLTAADWPQLGGAADHRNTGTAELVPPLHALWARAVDGNLHGGSPVVIGSVVIAPIADFGDGTRGGAVAFDVASGAELWRYRAGAGVRSAPAATADTVVIAGVDGMVHALATATGELRWTYQVSETAEAMSRSVYASPAIAGDVVFVGNQREFVALELATGEPAWTIAPGQKGFFGSYVTPAVSDDLVIATFAMGGVGLHAWDVASGTLAWATDGAVTTGMMASPVVDDTTVYIVDWETRVTALDRFTGEQRWSRKIDDAGFAWGYGATATPALAGDTLFVPTHHGGLFALDRRSGAELWRLAASPGHIRATHYQGTAAAAFAASPVVAGSLVWLGGVDGVLRAIDRASGELVWNVDLGAPVTMGAALAGDLIVVGTYDGTLRALVPADRLELSAEAAAVDCPSGGADVPDATSPPGDGCGCQGGESGTGAWLLAVAAVWALRRRRGGSATTR